jgi:hypothetical protein
VLVVIMICALLVGFDVDLKEEESPQTHTFLLHLNTLVNLFFLAEIIAKVHQVGWEFFGGGMNPSLAEVGWNVLDYLIVTIGTAEILTTYLAPNDEAGEVTKMFKIFRMARLLRLAKSLRFVQGFTLPAILADALGATIPFVTSVFLLLCIVLCIGSMMLRELTQPDTFDRTANRNEWVDHYDMYFGTTLRGMFTVLTFFTGEGFGTLVRGGGWGGVSSYAVAEVREESGSPPSGMNIQVFATSAACWLCSACLFSVLTSTVADKVMSLYEENHGALSMLEKAKEAEVQRRLQSFAQALDRNGNGLVRCADVLNAFDIDHINSLFTYLGMRRDDMSSLFKSLDCGKNGTIDLRVLQRLFSQPRGDAHALDLYKLYATAARVSKRVLQMQDQVAHFVIELDQVVDGVQWHNQRYEDVEAVAVRAETRKTEHFNYLKQKDNYMKSLEHFAVRKKAAKSSLSSKNGRPRSRPASGSIRRTRPPVQQAGETAPSFGVQDPASTTSSLNPFPDIPTRRAFQ